MPHTGSQRGYRTAVRGTGRLSGRALCRALGGLLTGLAAVALRAAGPGVALAAGYEPCRTLGTAGLGSDTGFDRDP